MINASEDSDSRDDFMMDIPAAQASQEYEEGVGSPSLSSSYSAPTAAFASDASMLDPEEAAPPAGADEAPKRSHGYNLRPREVRVYL